MAAIGWAGVRCVAMGIGDRLLCGAARQLGKPEGVTGRLATKVAWRPAERSTQVNQVGACDVHVRPAARADAPGIVGVAGTSILPGEDAGFGGSMDSPFHDPSALLAAWRDPNVVQGEEILVADWQHLGYRVTHEEENSWTRSIGPGAREIRMRKELPPP